MPDPLPLLVALRMLQGDDQTIREATRDRWQALGFSVRDGYRAAAMAIIREVQNY